MKKAKSVLVIEDDVWFAQQHIRMLRHAGFNARHAADGIAGIEMLDDELPDAVVLDIFLPGPNGLALLHEIKSYTDLSRVPIIICTGSASLVSLEQLSPYGVTSMLDKGTMKPDDITRAVRRVLV